MESIPLGALAHLLPASLVGGLGVGDDERTGLFHGARGRAAAGWPATDRLVLLVDDLDLLDETSVAVLVPLVVSRTAFLIGTVRTDRVGRTSSPRLTGLQRDGHLVRLDVEPLGRDELGVLLHRALDHPVAATALDELARLSGGNLQVLTELVRGAIGTGRARARPTARGTWWVTCRRPRRSASWSTSTSPVSTKPASRCSSCSPCASASASPTSNAATVWPPSRRLEAGRLVSLVVAGRRTAVRLAHPLYGEVLRARMPPLRLRRIQHELADIVEGHGSRRREDVVQVALWRIESGGRVAGDQLLQAARLALAGHDPNLAMRLIAAWPEDDDTGAFARAEVLAEAYHLLGQHDDVERVVTAALRTSSPTRSALRCRFAWRGPDSRRSETSTVRSQRWTKHATSCATPTSSAASRVAARCCSPTPAGLPTRSRSSTRSSCNRTRQPTSSWRPPER